MESILGSCENEALVFQILLELPYFLCLLTRATYLDSRVWEILEFYFTKQRKGFKSLILANHMIELHILGDPWIGPTPPRILKESHERDTDRCGSQTSPFMCDPHLVASMC